MLGLALQLVLISVWTGKRMKVGLANHLDARLVNSVPLWNAFLLGLGSPCS